MGMIRLYDTYETLDAFRFRIFFILVFLFLKFSVISIGREPTLFFCLEPRLSVFTFFLSCS